jgi:hypothetical protein
MIIEGIEEWLNLHVNHVFAEPRDFLNTVSLLPETNLFRKNVDSYLKAIDSFGFLNCLPSVIRFNHLALSRSFHAISDVWGDEFCCSSTSLSENVASFTSRSILWGPEMIAEASSCNVISFSPKGTHLAALFSVNSNQSLHLYEISSKTWRVVFDLHGKESRSLSWHPDSQHLLIAVDHELIRFTIESDKFIEDHITEDIHSQMSSHNSDAHAAMRNPKISDMLWTNDFLVLGMSRAYQSDGCYLPALVLFKHQIQKSATSKLQFYHSFYGVDLNLRLPPFCIRCNELDSPVYATIPNPSFFRDPDELVPQIFVFRPDTRQGILVNITDKSIPRDEHSECLSTIAWHGQNLFFAYKHNVCQLFVPETCFDQSTNLSWTTQNFTLVSYQQHTKIHMIEPIENCSQIRIVIGDCVEVLDFKSLPLEALSVLSIKCSESGFGIAFNDNSIRMFTSTGEHIQTVRREISVCHKLINLDYLGPNLIWASCDQDCNPHNLSVNDCNLKVGLEPNQIHVFTCQKSAEVQIALLTGHIMEVDNFAYCCGRNVYVSKSDQEIRIWDCVTLACIQIFNLSNPWPDPIDCDSIQDLILALKPTRIPDTDVLLRFLHSGARSDKLSSSSQLTVSWNDMSSSVLVSKTGSNSSSALCNLRILPHLEQSDFARVCDLDSSFDFLQPSHDSKAPDSTSRFVIWNSSEKQPVFSLRKASLTEADQLLCSSSSSLIEDVSHADFASLKESVSEESGMDWIKADMKARPELFIFCPDESGSLPPIMKRAVRDEESKWSVSPVPTERTKGQEEGSYPIQRYNCCVTGGFYRGGVGFYVLCMQSPVTQGSKNPLFFFNSSGQYEIISDFENPSSGAWQQCCLIARSDLLVVSSTQANELHVHRLSVAANRDDAMKWTSWLVPREFSCERVIRLENSLWYENPSQKIYFESRPLTKQTVFVRDSVILVSKVACDHESDHPVYVLQFCSSPGEVSFVVPEKKRRFGDFS